MEQEKDEFSENIDPFIIINKYIEKSKCPFNVDGCRIHGYCTRCSDEAISLPMNYHE